MPADVVDEAVELVLGVARLGEADLAGWWGSHGLDRTGQYVLSRTFRRSWGLAALELDLLSAIRRHRESLGGRQTALHLFSDVLPFRRWASAWLAEQKAGGQPVGLPDEMKGWDIGQARTWITRNVASMPEPEVIGGGLYLGEVSQGELEDKAVLQSTMRMLAACYAGVDAPFRVPYFNLRGQAA